MPASANIIRQWFHWVTLSAAIALLTACGGGGGDNDQAPVAIDGSLSTMVDTPANGILSAVDPDDTSLTFSISLHASLGTVTLIDDKTGEFSYTPNADTTGNDAFQFQASDGKKSSAPATITVEITANLAPVANNDNFTVDEGAAISANVINNLTGQDTDPENQPLSAELLTNPANGNLTIFNSDGSFTYTHNGRETISDSFTYRVNDGKSNSNIATVNFTINPINDRPVASDDTDATKANVVLNIPASSILFNDTDPDIGDSLNVIAADSVSAQGATVTLNAGNIRYDPTGVAAFIALSADQTLSGPDTFSYTVSDGNGGTDTATVSVTVTGVNDAPAAADDSGATTNANVILTIPASSVLFNDTDPDTSDSLSVTAADSVSAQGAIVTLNAGNIRYDPTGVTAFIALAANQTLPGPDTFSYTVSDGNGGTDTATVSVTVTGVNNAPVALATCSTMRRETPLNGTLNANDPDTSDLLTYSVDTQGSKGTVTINSSTGDYTYTPLDNKKWGIDSFTYRVEDLEGAFDIGTETVIIDPRIMPLGDSITRGFGPVDPSDEHKISYRKPLYDGLVAAGYSFDFVGTVKTDGTNLIYAPFDVDSEGHGGWWAKHIAYGNLLEPTAGNITTWLDATSPDVILLHIGTNGLGDPSVHENAWIDVVAILDKIDTWEIANGDPITVILARIIDQDPHNSLVTDFNNELDAMVAGRIGDDIIVVDMENVLTPGLDDYSDGVHPTNAGYAKMAPVWQTALTAQANNILYNNKCP